MLEIVLLGLNHKTAPVEIRECLAVSKDETAAMLGAIKEPDSINEVVLFSTCNRVEILMVASDKTKAVETAKKQLSAFKNVPLSKFEQSIYVYEGDEAVRHIFRVASSLDSMMIGEPQILGQIKEAYLMATKRKTSGVILNRLLHRTFFVAKRVRTETGIGSSAVSISYAAIELARKIFGLLEDKKVLLIGAGEMAELAVEHLIRNKVKEIFIANRTFKNGVELARRFGGNVISFEEITDFIKQVDIIISSTGSSDIIITKKQVKQIMPGRKNRPLFFIDIAVPRDIDPEINKLNNTYVYDIDDLNGVIDENIEDRNKEAIKGERIIDEAVINFKKWYDSLDVVPTIVELRNKIDSIVSAEVEKTMQSIKLSESDREALSRMKNALINKIVHNPILLLKRDGCHGSNSIYIDVVRKLFKLDD
ncbi:MAG: glutamyl-tRNA reductase [Proteobacteria bacterium]|nr:glutamyl-tRNA reductase [Pseudomonadota bacterium]MBU4009951.1 glutamyl-tRNA reductase [Pseudomonadota bacterium]MBU4035309.1 glutamyl-tRNA reductase [Pseudomonadota bacterium]